MPRASRKAKLVKLQWYINEAHQSVDRTVVVVATFSQLVFTYSRPGVRYRAPGYICMAGHSALRGGPYAVVRAWGGDYVHLNNMPQWSRNMVPVSVNCRNMAVDQYMVAVLAALVENPIIHDG